MVVLRCGRYIEKCFIIVDEYQDKISNVYNRFLKRTPNNAHNF